MNKQQLIKYWVDISEQDYVAFENLFKSKDYSWTLFIGHLVLEKLLKALIVQNNEESTMPKSHNLLLLANKANLELDESKTDLLDMFTTFNINARYPDYKQNFYKKCTAEYTRERVKEIKEVREWLYSLIEK
jgi:HEPN domain-containing protein